METKINLPVLWNKKNLALKLADFDDSDKLKDATASYDLGTKEAADQYCSLFKLMENTDKGVSVTCSGTKVTIKGFANIDSDDEEESVIGKSKEEFKKLMETEQQMTCK